MGAARGRGGRWGLGLGAVLLALLLVVSSVKGERTQRGNVIASLDGGISPLRLPRDRTAPASVRLSGELRTDDRSRLPRLRRVELALAGRGGLDVRGLPICRRSRLRGASPETAMAVCGTALVGHGRLDVKVFFPGQRPFVYRASLRAFNGRTPEGEPLVWLHVFGPDPPSAFVLSFAVRNRRGDFPTALVATVPREVGPWPHVARFAMTFGRRYSHRGRLRSYLNASCPVPPRFTAGIFPFARATYEFVNGRRLEIEIVRSCRVRSKRGER